MTTKIGTNVVDLVFYHIFHNFFSQTIDYVTAHFTVTQPFPFKHFYKIHTIDSAGFELGS